MVTTTLMTMPGGSVATYRHVVDHGPDARTAGRWFWVEPGTPHMYPLSSHAYRRAREAEEKAPPGQRALGRGRGLTPANREVEVILTIRPDASPRIRRIVREVLRAIRRGQPAGDAISRVARRFGLRQAQARAFIAASIGFEVTPRPGSASTGRAGPRAGRGVRPGTS